MTTEIINIGILAHVDAGKTSLTERLLFETGVITHVGSVDRGDTQTDSMELEQRRGITIRSAVASFRLDGVRVNLIDTPGHPDFIAEVERALRVLDAAILVVSAAEGVQAQTRILMRILERLRMPALIFVNKIDRTGARAADLLAEIRRRLTAGAVAMGTARDLGTAYARFVPYRTEDPAFRRNLGELLAEHSDEFLARYLDDPESIGADACRAELARQTAAALVHPVLLGSAITGEGTAALLDAVRDLLPVSAGDRAGELRGTVFKIDRSPSGEKIAYVRLFAGTLRPRDIVPVYRHEPDGTRLAHTGKVSAVRVFDHGTGTTARPAHAGEIAQVWGLREVRIDDRVGSADAASRPDFFPRPSLETVVRPVRPDDAGRLYPALQRLAEQDPLIDVHRDDATRELSVRLYGEVQKEVLATTLHEAFGIEVTFAHTHVIHIEKPVGTGSAVEEIGEAGNVFCATVGLRVEPGEPGGGVTFSLAVELGALPAAFHKAIKETVRTTLRQGLYGWEVTDCRVTLTRTGYFSPVSAAGDFRKLTPLVLMEALRQAGTRVHEPVNRFELEVPADTTTVVFAKLAGVSAIPQESTVDGAVCRIQGTIAASRVHEFEQQIPGITHGEGVFLSEFHGYQAVSGKAPTRGRTDHNPLHRAEYLLHTRQAR